jgi:hypothetical protein
VALETWIEGKKYFDRAADLARRPALDRERADLVARAKRMGEKKPEAEDAKPPSPGLTRPPERPEIPPTPPPAPQPTTTPRSRLTR